MTQTPNSREVKRYPVEFMYVDENNDYQLIPHVEEWLHQELQKAREEERGRVVDEIAYAFSKHRDAELSELNRSNNRKETKEYLTKGIEVFYLEFLRRLDTVKPIDHSELDTPITNEDNLK